MNEQLVTIVPLVNFDCDTDFVRLDSSLCLKRISHKEVAGLIRLAPGYRFPLEDVLVDVKYIIEKKLSRDDVDDAEFSSYAARVVLALRLLKEGSIAIPTAFRLDSSRKSSSVSEPTPRTRVIPGFSPLYLLKEEEIPVFKNIWRKLQDVKKEKPHLDFPLAQFAKSFEDIYPEDMVVDCVIALESLVFHKERESIQQAGRVIGIAIGMLLGKNQQEREKIKEKLTKAYAARNAIVHGNMPKIQKYEQEILGIMSDTQGCLREALRKLVEE